MPLDYLQASGLQIGRINQEIYNASVSADLGVYGIKSPLASDGIQVVFGTEWRRDTLRTRSMRCRSSGQLAGSGGPTIGISGGTKVEELFMEARVPIAQDRAGMESLSFDTAYRYSDYGDGVQTDTYKFGLEWAPMQDVRLRGSYQQAVRAANIVELFTAQGFNLFDMTGDPCGADARDPEASDAECIASGVPAGNVGANALDSPAGPVQLPPGRQSGTVAGRIGHVLVRRRVHAAVRAGARGHDRLLRHQDRQTRSRRSDRSTRSMPAISSNDPVACDRINRNPDGQLWVGTGHVEDLNTNIGSLSTKGYDLNVTYSGLEMGRFGSLNFNLTGTLVDELITEPAPGIDPFDCVGFLLAELCRRHGGRADAGVASPVPHELA